MRTFVYDAKAMTHTVDEAFCKALPKLELHAHLTGSITPTCLHDIWKKKCKQGISTELEDPLIACQPEGAHHDIYSFFKIFDRYIYGLCNDSDSVAYATSSVLSNFEDDGVRYLELRTTPREAQATGLTKEAYVEVVLDTIERHGRERMSTYLILSVDRRNTREQALDVVRLAKKYQDRGVVGVDLCGNPLQGDVRLFRDAFSLAESHRLQKTIHFAEMPESSTETELRTLLSYQPDRIGHVINVPPDIEAEIEARKLGLELCLSCNVHAKMVKGGFKEHHFGKWYKRSCPIALCTDDVGVFGSSVSNEYLLAAANFELSRVDVVQMCSKAVSTIFGGEREKSRMLALLQAFRECDPETASESSV